MRSALSASRSASILDLRAAAFLALSVCTRSPLSTSDKACGNTEYLLTRNGGINNVLHLSHTAVLSHAARTHTHTTHNTQSLRKNIPDCDRAYLEHTHTCTCTQQHMAYLEHGLLGGVSPHLLLNGLLLTLSLCLGQEGTIEHGPSVLDQHLQ